MPSNIGMSAPTVIVNDQVIAIVPDTLKQITGKGEDTVRTESAGGGSVSVVVTRNPATMKSKVTFELVTRSANIDLVKTWKANNWTGGNTIECSELSSTNNYIHMTLTIDPEIATSVEGTITVEFEGPPAL